MVIGIFGESCTGKSTIAEALAKKTEATLYSGKDYLRLAKSEVEAKNAFAQLLQNGVNGDEWLIYVTTEKEDLSLLPQGAIRVLVTADIALIKERFSQRMGGRELPPPVAAMLEKKHGMFDSQPHDFHAETNESQVQAICESILALCKSKG